MQYYKKGRHVLLPFYQDFRCGGLARLSLGQRPSMVQRSPSWLSAKAWTPNELRPHACSLLASLKKLGYFLWLVETGPNLQLEQSFLKWIVLRTKAEGPESAASRQIPAEKAVLSSKTHCSSAMVALKRRHLHCWQNFESRIARLVAPSDSEIMSASRPQRGESAAVSSCN